MKKLLAIVCVLSLLLLCACTTEPTTTKNTTEAATTQTAEVSKQTGESTADTGTEPVVTQPDDTMIVSNVYIYGAGDESGDVLGVVLNEPYDVDEPSATDTWIEGEYERAYIVPAYIGSRVALYELTWDENGNSTKSDKPVCCVESSQDGCVIYSALMRPEGYPMYYLEITAPNGEKNGYTLSYNGRTGTPAREYLYAD